jgi:hypothetical protein
LHQSPFAGGASNDGTVFEIVKSVDGYANSPTTLVNFNGTDGSGPVAGLIADAAGDLFGTTTGGGVKGEGTVFELSNPGFQVANSGLLGGLNVNQQLELIYISYFDRSADGGGFNFWVGQNATAQNAGESAPVALTNIANSFTPQPETVAIYSFLAPLVSGGAINLNSPTAQAGLTAFVGSVYQNLFNRAADAAGQSYWVGQITSSAVGLGAAALAIANGATGADAIELQNKIAVALDFTNRTAAANLNPLASTFLAAARGVLSGVDGVSLNDASVRAGESATTTYIAGAATGHQTAFASVDPNVITVTGSDQLIDLGTGGKTIQFLAGASMDTVVLHSDGVDQISGFDPVTDGLDLRLPLATANVDLGGNMAVLGNFVTVADRGSDAVVSFDPTGHGGGGTVAVLHGLGGTGGLAALIAQNAVRVT